MSNRTRRPSSSPPASGRPLRVAGAAAPALCRLALIAALAAGHPALGQEATGRQEDPVADSAGLLPGLHGRISVDGRLEFLATGTGRSILSLQVIEEAGQLRDRRFAGVETRFVQSASEGQTGGARGFSARADDDRDGATDEDPLDGSDNDQDGWIDEDYAAIGDTMVVVHAERPGRILHQEFFRWAHGYLRPAIFLSVRRTGDAGDAVLRVLGDGPWVEAGITCCLHSIGGQTQQTPLRAFVAKAGRAAGPDYESPRPGEVWLGVMVLDQNSRRGTDFRILLNEGRLDFPLAVEPLPVAVCAAESWLQLCNLLGEAARVFHGVTDPVSGLQAGWIVPARCVRCRMDEPPEFRWNWTATGGVSVWAEVETGRNPILDPDLFRVNDQALGSPIEVAWIPVDGEPQVVPWAGRTLDDLRTGAGGGGDLLRDIPDWYRHEGQGRVSFRFDDLPAEARDVLLRNDVFSGALALTGRTISGRPVTAALQQDSRPLEAAGSGGARIGAGADPLADRSRLKLSPELLKSWPNPFRDQIQIRVQVPQTLEEAFVWDEGVPAGMDLQAAVPWRQGQPQVTVKVYSVNGQELATLFTGEGDRGEFAVSWDGKDSFGRPVASGTYFCKLQLDDLSVTRRIVYLR